MHVTSRVIVVTGGAEGIGRALVERFHKEGAKAIVVADRNAAGAEAVAKSVGGLALACDVGNEADIQKVVSEAESRAGPIDLFCSNAGMATSAASRTMRLRRLTSNGSAAGRST